MDLLVGTWKDGKESIWTGIVIELRRMISRGKVCCKLELNPKCQKKNIQVNKEVSIQGIKMYTNVVHNYSI